VRRIAEAIAHFQQALDLAKQKNQSALAEDVQARLRLYEAGTPYREPQQPK